MARCLWCAKCIAAGGVFAVVLLAVSYRVSEQFDANLWGF